MMLRQVNKSRMYLATNLVLNENRALYASIDELVNVQERFSESLAMIGNYRQVQEANHTGLTSNKAMLKVQLTAKLQKVIAALAAHATTTKDIVLLARVNYRPSALRKSDQILVDIAKLVLNEARNQGNALDKYFVFAADFTELENLVLLFKEAIPKKRVASTLSKVSTNNIARVFADTDKLLKTEADVLMAPFRFTQPDFFYSYKNARKIVNYAGRKQIQEGPLAGETQS